MAAYIARSNIGRLFPNHLSASIIRPDLNCLCHKQIHAFSSLRASLHTSRRIASKHCVLTSRVLSRRLGVQTSPLTTAFLRYNSSESGSTVVPNPSPDVSSTTSTSYLDPPAGYIPPAPPIPEASSVSGVDPALEVGLNALGEPSLQSLGLGSLWPSGLVQQGLEMLHVGLGLPWWGSIVAGTVIVRLCMFPIVVKAQKMSINMMNHMPTIQKLQLKFTQARQRGNMLEAMRYGGELGEYMKKHNVKPFGQMIMPLCQAPVFVSVFVGLRGMANLPVESMKEGGILFFTDLTITQPFYALPLMTALTFWLTIEAGVDGMNAQAQTHVMKWFLRLLPFAMWPFISNFPT
ncbi:adenosylhomocysteinase, partial [Plakobranchus ocellatus]